MTHELLGQLAARKETFTENPVTAGQMGELIDMVQSRQLTGTPFARVIPMPTHTQILLRRELWQDSIETHDHPSVHRDAINISCRAILNSNVFVFSRRNRVPQAAM